MTLYVTPAKTSGVTMPMSDSGTFPRPVSGAFGTTTSSGGGGGAGRGGRLNGMVPAAPVCRRGSNASGRSAATTGRTSSSSAPRRNVVRWSRATGATTGSPATHDPLCDPRSSTVTSPQVERVSEAWRRDSVPSASTISQPGARPTTIVPGVSGKRRPASSPLTTTSSRSGASRPDPVAAASVRHGDGANASTGAGPGTTGPPTGGPQGAIVSTS